MIEAYKIGVTLTLKGDAQQKLAQFVQTSKRAAEAVEKLNRQMRPLYDSFSKLDVYLQKINPRMDRLAYAFGDSRKNLSGLNQSFGGFNEKMSAAINKTESLIVKTDRLKRELSELGEAGMASGAGLSALAGLSVARAGSGRRGGGSRGHGGSLGHMHYKGAHLGAFGFTPGMAAAGVAMAVGYGVKASYETGKDYDRAFTQYKLMGLGGAANSQANNLARNENIKGVTSIGYMDALTDATMATRSIKEGQTLAPYLAITAYANDVNYHGRWNRKQEQDLIKFAEMRGGSDPNAILRELNLGQKMISASGGRVMPSDLLNFNIQSQTAGYHYTDSALYALEPVMQEMRAYKVGTGLQTGANQLIGGKGMSNAEARDLTKLGLLKPGGVVYDALKRRLYNKPGILTGEKVFQTDPVAWYENYYLPALKKEGITNPDDINKRTTYDFGRTQAAVFSNINKNQAKIDKARIMNPLGHGMVQSYQDAQAQKAGAEKDLSAAWTQLKTAFDAMTSPGVLGGMKFLTDFLNTTTVALKGFEQIAGAISKGSSFFSEVFRTPTISLVKNLYDKHHINAIPPSGTTNPVQVTTNIQLDGKVIAQAVSQHQGYQMSRTMQTSSNSADANMSLPSPLWPGR
jgi:hypothetical protein